MEAEIYTGDLIRSNGYIIRPFGNAFVVTKKYTRPSIFSKLEDALAFTGFKITRGEEQ